MGKSFFKKIIVAINGRQSSLHAAMYAVMMAKTYNITLKFVYVVDTATIKYLAMNSLIMTDSKYTLEEKLRADGQNYLNYAVMLASKKGVSVQTELRSGGVYTEILKAADEFDADLIVLGGNTSTDKSVSKNNVLSHHQNEVLSSSKCPVMIVQKPDIEKLFNIF